MKNLHRALGALAAIAFFSSQTTAEDLPSNAAQPTPTPATAPQSQRQEKIKDDANESPRERGRILVKRNPIASEYQVFGDVGSSPGADADGEGVDYRAFFSPQSPTSIKSDRLELGYSINYNAASGSAKSGGDVSFARRLGDDKRWAVTGNVRSSASDRLIEHYESVWQETTLGPNGETLYLLDRPRYSYDRIATRNNTAALNIGYNLTPEHTVFLKLNYQDYFDNAYRNRLELTFGGTNIDADSIVTEGDNIVSASTDNGRTRRYFGDTDNYRDRLHVLFGGSYSGAEWNIDYSLYMQRWDLDTLWHDWNFNDSNLALTYHVDDPYLPTFTNDDGFDILDTSSTRFTSLRVHDSFTRDRDKAARIDAERRLTLFDHNLWLQTGALARAKQRAVGQQRDVYGVNASDPLYLGDITFGESPLEIVRGRFTLQDGLDPAAGAAALDALPNQFLYDPFKAHTEAQPQFYDAEESVYGAYGLVVAESDPLTFEIGLRAERTETATRGRVLIPAAVNDPSEGVLIEVIDDPKSNSDLILKDLYAENNYTNILPSVEASYDLSDSARIKASYFELLMRPQYFNIVDYRRISVPTRGVSEGNPNLEPTTIKKTRLAWIKELSSHGQFSVEAYSISISSFFYGAVSTEYISEDGVPTLYRVSRVENGESGRIQGLEIQWSQDFDSLAVFKKANASLAYTFSDSEATVATRPEDRITVPERSRHLAKASFRGNLGKLTTSFEIAYQSRALDNVGVSSDQDDYREAVISTEFGARFPLTQKVSVYANLYNLTDHPERSYEGDPIRVSQNQYSSWFGVFGIKRQF